MSKPIVVKEYKNAKDFERDAPKMAQAGYEIVSTTNSKAKSGITRKATSVLLPVAIFFPHKDHLVVTYQKTF